MKNLWFAVLVVVVIAGFLLAYNQQAYLFRGQVIERAVQPQEIEEVEDCSKLSEVLANTCYQRLALEAKDASLCDDISKTRERQRCQREVELLP